MASSSHHFGELVEKKACLLLQNFGFQILSRRYRIRGGEIDVIAKKDNLLLFGEVKARKKVFDYDCVLSQQQLSRIVLAAEKYVNDNTSLSSCNIRFDLFIFEDCTKQLFHFENVTM